MDPGKAGEVTRLLARWKGGDSGAFDELLPFVYGELRDLADRYLARERAGHTLEPTALVHEAYLRLSKVAQLDTEDRSHFYAVAARTMRRILVDHARQQRADMRVGAHQKEPLTGLMLGFGEEPVDILDVHAGLEQLEKRQPRAARLVELRFFAGMSESEAATALGSSRATITRDWRFAKLWLYDYLHSSAEHG